ncbi:2Fe-2S iron-sulfur cluster-binding protein [Flavobacterium saccharophilum]|uniref:Ferredoxin, 2Fe-2S n=1 Tax=Flavobacterium saccharophilum TaxID=29534 RepID=A0A1M7JI68_9FLAO|nr:2Fe-2S iron-sulfur cluster-binding protein [Flavobacterium saccharophilum]SHM52648.1 ferredoxin, 2Fe-2S [Flavobacterium saccharophilum]
MAKITFITKDNQSIVVEGTSGSVMELAKQANVKGIDGDCGGVCSCATCHIYLNEADLLKTGPASEIEKDMLELDDDANEFSRLCCQIEVSEAIDGVVFQVVR